VLRRFGQILVIVALLAALGTHGMVLHSVAWTRMLADNLRTTSVAEAVQRTFDGKHPCTLCKHIAKGKQSEKKAEFPLKLQKFEFVSVRPIFVFSPPQHFDLVSLREQLLRGLSQDPPVPPPRSLPA
jgi:hypothetical protein